MHLFCFGLGYVAKALANNLNCKVSGTHRGTKNLAENEYIFNQDSKFSSSILDDVTHILISIPPTELGDPVFLEYGEYLKSLTQLKWIGYLSSTSVYGDHQGAWVDEQSETKTTDAIGINRLIAEEQWLNSGLPVNIFRACS